MDNKNEEEATRPKKRQSVREIIVNKREYFRANLYDKYHSARKEKRDTPPKKAKKQVRLDPKDRELRKAQLMEQSRLPGNMMNSEDYLLKKREKIRKLEQKLFDEHCTFKPSIRNMPKFVSARYSSKVY